MTYENLSYSAKISIVLGIIVFCAFLSSYPMIFVYMILVLSVLTFGLLLINKSDRVIIYLILLVLFQNFIAIIAAKQAGNIAMQGIILMKELLSYSILPIIFVKNYRKLKLTHPDIFAMLYIIILVAYLIFPTSAPIFVKLIQFRQLITPVILYLLGRVLLVQINRTEGFLKFIVHLSVISVFFGFLERFILGDNFWVSLGIQQYLSTKGMDLYAFGPGGLPGNFYTFDYISFVGTTLRRMASFVADPTLFGQFLVLPISILLFTKIFKRKQKFLYSTILVIGLLLTLSKGGIFSLVVAVIYKLFRSKYRPIGYLVLAGFVFATSFILINAHIFSSLPAHIKGLTHNFELMYTKPFGLGLGQSGNLAVLYSSSRVDLGSGESFIGLVFGQLGIFSVIFLFFLISLINKFRKNKIKNEYMKNLSVVFAATLIGTIASSFISESAISFISAGILFLMCGVVVSNNIDYKKASNN